MKNKLIYIFIIFSLLSTVIASSYALTLRKENKRLINENLATYPEIYNYLDSVTFSTFKKKINNDDTFIIYFSRPTCTDCNLFDPQLIELIGSNSNYSQIIYLNLAKLRTNEEDWSDFKKTYNIIYTPTIAKYEDGKLISKIEWTPEKGINMNDVSIWLSKNF